MARINLFEDKEYDQLDWLNKAVEPFNFPPNDVLAAMPELIELDFDTIMTFCYERHSLSIDLDAIISWAAEKAQVEIPVNCTGFIREQYKLETDSNTVIDLEEKTLTGFIRAVKLKNQLNDEEIVALLSQKLYEKLRYVKGDTNLNRLNEILDLIGVRESRASRSPRKKVDEIAYAMSAIIKEDKWRLRDAELILKIGDWIRMYAEDGNLAAMSNFTRLKCMVHKGVPIYSMEEAR